MSALKNIVEKSNSPIKDQLFTLCDVIELLERKLTDNFEKYQSAPLSIEATKADGSIVSRANPFVEEFRSTIKDYNNALIKFQDLLKIQGQKTELKSLDELRSKFKIAK